MTLSAIRPASRRLLVCAIALAAMAMAGASQAQLGKRQDDSAASNSDSSSSSTNGTPSRLLPADNATGPIKLRTNPLAQGAQDGTQPNPDDAKNQPPQTFYVPGEFERYVQKLIPFDEGEIRRFGAELVTDVPAPVGAQDPLPLVPADYIIQPGDEIVINAWGSVDADLRVIVDRSGRIAIPRVGTIVVAGLRHGELSSTLNKRAGQTFRNFQISASLGQLRSVRVFVAGFVQRPGSQVVNGLSSVLHVLMRAGGPNAAGSFRNIQLVRAGRVAAEFDLYDLMLKGDRRADQLVQPDDIIRVGPAGAQVAILGSVNQQAVFELRPGENLSDALAMAGGFNSVADRSRVAIERLADRNAGKVTELDMASNAKAPLSSGDVIRVFSHISAVAPIQMQRKRVRMEGEVNKPGDYVLPVGSTLEDAVRAAGGLTPAAFVFGTEFNRESVRLTQQQNYDKALREMEADMARSQASSRASTADEVRAQTASAAENTRLVTRLRAAKPTGRIVLELAANAQDLPPIPLEDGDRVLVPSRGTSVGVFGSVFSAGSFLFTPGRTTGEYLKLAGGPTRGADERSMFLLRANGSVISARQTSGWLGGNSMANAEALPGDAIFVPEEMEKSTFTQNTRDWTQILYQFGLGMAGIKSLGL